MSMQESFSTSKGWEPLTTVNRQGLETIFGKQGIAQAVSHNVLTINNESFVNRKPHRMRGLSSEPDPTNTVNSILK